MGKKWNQNDVNEIHHLYRTGLSAKIIANIMSTTDNKVSADSVRYIIYRREPSKSSIERLYEKQAESQIENAISKSKKERQRVETVLEKIQRVFFPVKKS